MNDLTNYNEVKHLMKTGDCIQWRTSSIVGWLIRLFSKGEVNHSSLVITLKEYSDRRFLLEALSEIELRVLSKRLAEFDGEAWWYPLKDKYNGCRKKIGQWTLLQAGIDYDYGGVIRQIAGRVSADVKKLWCSEFCFFGWKFGGVPLKGKAPRPVDIPKYKIFKKPVKLI